MKAFLSPQASAVTPVNPGNGNHNWPLAYGSIYTDDVGSPGGGWDFDTNAAWVTNIGVWTTDRQGVSNSSLVFSSGNFKVNQSTVRTLGTTQTFWIRSKGNIPHTPLSEDAGSFGSFIRINSTSVFISLAYLNGASILLDETVSSSNWYDWIIIQNGVTIDVWKNAVYQGQGTCASAVGFKINAIGLLSGDTPFNVDQIVIWDRELTEGEILFLYQH